MTDRFNYLIVGLEKEIREDDAEHLINAIKMLKGVLDVKGNISKPNDWIAQQTAAHEIRKKLWDVLS